MGFPRISFRNVAQSVQISSSMSSSKAEVYSIRKSDSCMGPIWIETVDLCEPCGFAEVVLLKIALKTAGIIARGRAPFSVCNKSSTNSCQQLRPRPVAQTNPAKDYQQDLVPADLPRHIPEHASTLMMGHLRIWKHSLKLTARQSVSYHKALYIPLCAFLGTHLCQAPSTNPKEDSHHQCSF